MSTRVTEHEIVRGEIQDLFHQTFNLLQSARQEMMDELSITRVPAHEEEFLRKMGNLVGLLNETYEQLRSRVLPIVG